LKIQLVRDLINLFQIVLKRLLRQNLKYPLFFEKETVKLPLHALSYPDYLNLEAKADYQGTLHFQLFVEYL